MNPPRPAFYFPWLSLDLEESLALQPSLPLQVALSLALQPSFDLQPSLALQPFLSTAGGLVELSVELCASAGRAVMTPAIAAAIRNFVVVFIGYYSFWLISFSSVFGGFT
jgi:hypothetical protein